MPQQEVEVSPEKTPMGTPGKGKQEESKDQLQLANRSHSNTNNVSKQEEVTLASEPAHDTKQENKNSS